MEIRDEAAGDATAITGLIIAAFAGVGVAHASGTEAALVERLRRGRALALSLVATDGARARVSTAKQRYRMVRQKGPMMQESLQPSGRS